MSIHRYKITGIEGNQPMLPMISLPHDELELMLRRMKDGDVTVFDTMSELNRMVDTAYWRCVHQVLKTKPAGIGDTIGQFEY